VQTLNKQLKLCLVDILGLYTVSIC